MTSTGGPPDIQTDLRLIGNRQWVGSGICRICKEEIQEASGDRVEAWFTEHKTRHGV
jgi:hypothetical protein